MKRFVCFLRSILPNFILILWREYRTCKILSRDYGHFLSLREKKCVDKNGDPIPWYTYPAIEYLSNLDFSQKRVLEWGGGMSSIYWSKRCKSLTVIEFSKEWYEILLKLREKEGTKFDIYSAPDKNDFVSLPQSLNQSFDIIVIDSQEREKCAREACKMLNWDSPDGAMIILDNSDWYPETSKYLREQTRGGGLIEIDFHGFASLNAYTHTTSIFVTRNFCIQPNKQSQPHPSVAGTLEVVG